MMASPHLTTPWLHIMAQEGHRLHRLLACKEDWLVACPDLSLADIRANPSIDGFGRLALHKLLLGWLVNHLKVNYMIAR